MLKADFFTGNRKRLVNLLESNSLIVVAANGLMQRNADSAFTFRQDSNFFYLTGIEEPNTLLVIDTQSGEEYIILPAQTEVERYFGGNIDCDKVAKSSGIQQIYQYNLGWEKLKELQKRRKKIYSLQAPPVQFTRQERLFASPARRLLIQKLRRISRLPIEFINEQLATLRVSKQSEEVAVLNQAIDITRQGFERVREVAASGVFEYELEAEFDYIFKQQNAHHGYVPPIIASGNNATILHYNQNQAQLVANDLLLMDVGAECHNYSADISRTYKVNGKLAARERLIYTAVESVHHQAIELLKPGLSWKDYSLEIDRRMGEELLKLKLITMNTREQVRKFFPHAISHSLGLDVHDVCDYTKPLVENMVITVEPGIYLPAEGIGIRIEDDILITTTGAVNLSADIPYA